MGIEIAKLGNNPLLEGGHVDYDAASGHLTLVLAAEARPVSPGELLKLSTNGYITSWTPGWDSWLRLTVALIPLELAGENPMAINVPTNQLIPHLSTALVPQQQPGQMQMYTETPQQQIRKATRWNQLSIVSMPVSLLLDLFTLGTMGWIADIFGWVGLFIATRSYLRAKHYLPTDAPELKKARIWLWVNWGGRIALTIATIVTVIITVVTLANSGVLDISKYQDLIKILNTSDPNALNSIINSIGK